jgi:transcriptional regulator with XRE-family HTH domain
MNRQIKTKIKKLRVEKGLSQTEMADRLNITRTAYHNIESGESYSWARYLSEILDIFGTSPKDFFSDIHGNVINQSNFTTGAIGYVETLHQENREIYEKLLAAKDEQIALLKDLLEKK